MELWGQINCSSCGITLVGPSGQGLRPWGHSHNMPVKHFPELEADPKNFKPRCQNWEGREGCHEKLDYPKFEEIIKFNDFHDMMEYRRTHNIHAYNQWVSCLIAIGYNEYPYINE